MTIAIGKMMRAVELAMHPERELMRLRELLRVEFMRHNRIESPWECVEGDCPYLGKPIPRNGCACSLKFERDHVAAVKKELAI